MKWPRLWTSRDRDELERLRQSETRYRLMAEHAQDVLLQYDAAGVVQYVSPSVARFDQTPEALVGKTLMELAHPDDVSLVRSRLEAVGAGRALSTDDGVEVRFRCGDGSWRWVQGSPAPIFDAKGQAVGAISIMRDVTARLLLQEEVVRRQTETVEALGRLKESEARYRTLAENASDVIARVDVSNRIEFMSPSISAFGYRPQDMIGHLTSEFVHPDDQTGAVRRALLAGEPLPSDSNNEFRMRCADGRWVLMQGRPGPVYDDAGEPIGYVTVLRDITEQRRLEDELRRKEAEAQAATQAKSEFLATMSHEIRTPLTAVVGFAGLLAKMADLPEKAGAYVDRIARSGEALTTIVNNVLDFSKIEAGQLELRVEPVGLQAFVDDAVGAVSFAAEAKGLALTVRVEAASSVEVMVDAGRLRQVLLNLLTNAIKFTHEGAVTLHVAHDPAARTLRMSVTDTGIGIAPDAASRLFQRFSQLESSNARRFGGAGLGLAISRGLVELMGGEIGVESAEAQGSRFWFQIPVAPSAALLQDVELESAAPPAGARVLIVDDVRANRELIVALLSPFDLHLTEAENGLEALAAARDNAFDLVLMDLQMPGLDGIAATRAIRSVCELNRRTPIVAVSASVQPADVEACRQAGMDDHIAKPISARELVGKVAYWIGTPKDPGSARVRTGSRG